MVKFMILDFESHSNILVGASMIKVHERLNKMEKKLLWYYWPLVAAALKIGRRRGGERLYFCSLCKPKLLFQFHRPLGSMPKSFIGWIRLVILKNHKSYFKIILTNSQNFRLNTPLKSKTLDQLNIAIIGKNNVCFLKRYEPHFHVGYADKIQSVAPRAAMHSVFRNFMLCPTFYFRKYGLTNNGGDSYIIWEPI